MTYNWQDACVFRPFTTTGLSTTDWFPLENFFLLAALAVMILFMVLSNKKRKKQAEDLQTSIAVGSTVMLTSGVYGKVTSIDADRIVIESTPGTKLSVNKLAVRSVEAAKPAAEKPVAAKSATQKAAPKTATKKPAAKKPAATKTK